MNRRTVVASLVGSLTALLTVSWWTRLNGSVPDEALQFWTTADGRKVRIRDMTDNHLRNCIFFINKAYGAQHPLRVMGGSPSEISGPNLYDAMRREANRRRLSWI